MYQTIRMGNLDKILNNSASIYGPKKENKKKNNILKAIISLNSRANCKNKTMMLTRIYHLDRGAENIEKKLRNVKQKFPDFKFNETISN